jgi:hypothetical protein
LPALSKIRLLEGANPSVPLKLQSTCSFREYQAYLFRERKLAASTVTQRLAALRFFYTQTIKKAWSVADTPYPKKIRSPPSLAGVAA